MSLPVTDSEGRVLIDPAGVPVSWNAGLGYTTEENLCTTDTESPTDVWINGHRVSAIGQLVITPGVPPARPYDFNAGIPSDSRPGKAGSVIAQNNNDPAPTDPFVAGVRVGPLGGVYTVSVSNAPTPVLHLDASVPGSYTVDGQDVLIEWDPVGPGPANILTVAPGFLGPQLTNTIHGPGFNFNFTIPGITAGNRLMRYNGIVLGPGCCFVVVITPSATPTQYGALAMQSGTANNSIQGGAALGYFMSYTSGNSGVSNLQTNLAPGGAYSTNPLPVAPVASVAIISVPDDAPANVEFWVNGGRIATSVVGTVLANQTLDHLGGSDNLYTSSDTVHELIVFDTALTEDQIQWLSNELTAKWAIPPYRL